MPFWLVRLTIHYNACSYKSEIVFHTPTVRAYRSFAFIQYHRKLSKEEEPLIRYFRSEIRGLPILGIVFALNLGVYTYAYRYRLSRSLRGRSLVSSFPISFEDPSYRPANNLLDYPAKPGPSPSSANVVCRRLRSHQCSVPIFRPLAQPFLTTIYTHNTQRYFIQIRAAHAAQWLSTSIFDTKNQVRQICNRDEPTPKP